MLGLWENVPGSRILAKRGGRDGGRHERGNGEGRLTGTFCSVQTS